MGPDVIAPFMFFLILGAIILVPVWLRHRTYQLQLDVIAKALERGIDPASIQLKMPRQESGDIHVNRKARIILIGIGQVIATALGISGAITKDTHDEDFWMAMMAPFTLFVIGGALMYFHNTIVGKVYRSNEARPLRGEEGSSVLQ